MNCEHFDKHLEENDAGQSSPTSINSGVTGLDSVAAVSLEIGEAAWSRSKTEEGPGWCQDPLFSYLRLRSKTSVNSRSC